MWVRGFLDMQMPTLMAESKEELKSLLMTVKEESESWLKAQHSENKDHGIWSHHFLANDGETEETVADNRLDKAIQVT